MIETRKNYTLTIIDENNTETKIGELNNKQEVFTHIRNFLISRNKKIYHYRVVETDKYTQYKNGEHVFHLYKQKGE